VFKRRMPAQFGGGQIVVSPEAGLKFYRANLINADPLLFRMATELVRPGDVVWDIGANVGLFSFAAAALAGPQGRILAVEPDTWLVSLLRRSADLVASNRAQVVALPAAVSDCMGLGELHIASRARSANFMQSATSQAGGIRSSECVVMVTLDWLLQHGPAPQVLKIDVEGLEHRVLAGGCKFLAEARPRIWCEVSPENGEQVTSVLRRAGYDLFNAKLPPAERTPLPKAVWDTLALPHQGTSPSLP